MQAFCLFMNQKCSKCGAETEYKNDLHCREVFIEKIKDLLSSGKLEEAKDIYLSAPFDNTWKENFLASKGRQLQIIILEEAQRIKDEQENELLSKIKKVRNPNCYACKKSLSNLSKIECDKCGWIICSCGACGCGYDGQDFDDKDIL